MNQIAVMVATTRGISPGDKTVLEKQALRLADELHLTCVTETGDCGFEFLLCVTQSGLELVLNRAAAPGPVRVDFENPTLDYRIRNRVNRQAISRAVGIKPGLYPTVLDATAGLGKDSYLLASAGCRMQLLERNPIVHALLFDGLRRARSSQDSSVRQAASRMDLARSSLADYKPEADFDVVYLDPMFPVRSKSARVKKDMYVLQQFFSGNREKGWEEQLLRDALQIARRRVVIKRPARSTDFNGQIPTYRLEGKSSRFDIYVTGQFPGSR